MLGIDSLKSPGVYQRTQLAEKIAYMGFRTCGNDPDMWMRENNKAVGFDYWYYALLYLDDFWQCLTIHRA